MSVGFLGVGDLGSLIAIAIAARGLTPLTASMISPPLNKDYTRDHNIKALKGRGFINQGSTLCKSEMTMRAFLHSCLLSSARNSMLDSLYIPYCVLVSTNCQTTSNNNPEKLFRGESVHLSPLQVSSRHYVY